LTTQELGLLTFIHCSAWRTASRCRATVAGSTKSSANNSIPPRLLVAASVQIGWAPSLGSPGSERPPLGRVGRVLAAWQPPLLRSSRRLLRRPPPSARGLLR
jgi:hypothetical protein